MDGYDILDVTLVRRVDKELLTELGFDMTREGGRMCSLCPKDTQCHNGVECDLEEEDYVWVPTHVAAILKMQGG